MPPMDWPTAIATQASAPATRDEDRQEQKWSDQRQKRQAGEPEHSSGQSRTGRCGLRLGHCRDPSVVMANRLSRLLAQSPRLRSG